MSMEIRRNKIKVLELIQCLYQNQEIDNGTKTRLAQLLREEKYDEMKKALNGIMYGTTMPDIVRECINLITKQ